MSGGAETILIVNPSADVYGADLQMLQTVAALVERGLRVVVALPEDGELVPRLQRAGAEVYFLSYPVLRKGQANPRALVTMLSQAVAALPRATRFLRFVGPGLLLVNTVTLPWWLLAGRLAGVRTAAYLHEAETEARRLVRRALVSPLRLADGVIVISRASMAAMVEVEPTLGPRSRLIYNGVPEPEGEVAPARRGTPFRFAVVGRLSPRKAPDVALDAVGLLRAEGRDVALEIAGTPFAGYEWFEEQLRDRAAEPDLAGRVDFSGYVSPIAPVFARSDVVLAPSLREPFGNAVVEAQLARRPVIAAAAQGHLESIVDGVTGLLVKAGDAPEMAAAMRRLMDEPEFAERLAETGQAEARRRFSVQRYGREISDFVALTRA